MSRKQRDPWKPQRRGKAYCSPACGFGCTWEAYQLAVKQSAALARRLGKGWRARIWENGNWYWSVNDSTEVIAIHAYGKKKYTAYVNHRNGTSGNFVVEGTTPHKAVVAVIRRLHKEKKSMTALYNKTRESCMGALRKKKKR